MAKKKVTYQSAFDELEKISTQIASEEVDIDQITTLVTRANELVKICQDKLRMIEGELEKGGK